MGVSAFIYLSAGVVEWQHYCCVIILSRHVPLKQCLPNCDAVDSCEPLRDSRDPLTKAHHVYCNSSFVIFLYFNTFNYLSTTLLKCAIYSSLCFWHKGCLFDFPFYQGVHAESEFGKPCAKGSISASAICHLWWLF